MGNTHNSNFEKSEISDLIKDIKITKIHLQNYNDKYHITQKQKEIKLEQIQNTNHIIQIKLQNYITIAIFCLRLGKQAIILFIKTIIQLNQQRL